MAELQVEIRGLDNLVRALKNYPDIAEPILQRSVDRATAVLAKNTLKNDPVPWQTGNLLLSFRKVTGRFWARWFPTAPYAVYVNNGTGIYGPKGVPITPKTKHALYWEGAKHPVKSVKGMRPRKYMEKILIKAQPQIDEVFVDAMNAINKQIAGRVGTGYI